MATKRARYTVKRAPTSEEVIVRVPGVRGGDPVIKGTRITVTDVVRWAGIHVEELLGKTPRREETERLLEDAAWSARVFRKIHKDFPHVREGQIESAWSYYLSHRGEIHALLGEEDAAWERYAPHDDPTPGSSSLRFSELVSKSQKRA